MVKRWLMPGALIAAALMLVTGFAIAPRSAIAQDMSASPTAEHAPHPAHIHMGTCDTLGEVMYPLEDVTHIEDVTERPELAGMTEGEGEATPNAERDEMIEGAADSTPSTDMADLEVMANVIAQSTTTVDASLDDILAAEHAVNVHESMENIQNYIACGDITGTPTDGLLEIQLNELNGSGYEGMATLSDNGDGTTNVIVQLMMVEDGMATPTV